MTFTKSRMDKIREDFGKRSRGDSDNRWYKVPEPQRGENEVKATLRVLPPWNDDGNFYQYGGLHFNFSIAGKNRALGCLEAIGQGDCPVCQFVARLKKKNSDKTWDKLLRDIKRGDHYYINVIDRNNEENGVKIFRTNERFIKKILDYHEEEGIDITSATKGRDIIITRTGRGFRTRYPDIRIRSKRTTPPAFTMDDLHNLDDVIEYMDYNAMCDVIEENYGEEMAEVGFKFKRQEVTKKKSKKVVEEDDNESEDEEEEPIKKKVKKVKKVVKKKPIFDDDEDDDIDYDDIDEDEDE